MTHRDFVHLIAHRATLGQEELALLIRALICRVSPDLMERLDFTDDRIFLEPTLFAFFHAEAPSVPLEQLLFGYMDDRRKPQRVRIASDAQGVAYLPNLGYLYTLQPACEMSLHWEGSLPCSWLELEGQRVPFRYRDILRIPGTMPGMGIELYRTCPPLFRDFFRDPQGRPVDSAHIDVAGIARAKSGQVRDACAVIDTYASDYFASIRNNVRGILVYDAPHPYSFATLGAHGVAFLNARPSSSPVFFVEDILHQCGHIIFNAATVNKGEVLALDPETPLCDITDLDDYHGSLYEAFHGLFTQTSINTCLRHWSDSASLSGSHLHELRGRISDDMKRFAAAIHALQQRNFYTELGWDMFCHFRNTFVCLYQAQRELIERFDTSNQPYVFDYDKFLERNPLLPHALAERRDDRAGHGRDSGESGLQVTPGTPPHA